MFLGQNKIKRNLGLGVVKDTRGNEFYSHELMQNLFVKLGFVSTTDRNGAMKMFLLTLPIYTSPAVRLAYVFGDKVLKS